MDEGFKKQFTRKMGKREDPIYIDKVTGTDVLITPSKDVPDNLVKKGGKKTKKSVLKLRKIGKKRLGLTVRRKRLL